MQEHPPQDSGGYWRSLKKKEDSKGFTLVELIVVIVILAILAAILIPGLLKWIDQAKDKKYELEAREIAMAAEAAMAKMYAGNVEVLESGERSDVFEDTSGKIWLDIAAGSDFERSNFMNWPTFKNEIEKLTDSDLEIKAIIPYGRGSTGMLWEGSIRGFDIYFKSGEVKIKATFNVSGTNTDGWVIEKDSDISDWKSGWD